MQPSLPFDSASSPHPGALASPYLHTDAPKHGPVLVFVRHPRARRYIIRVADDETVRVTIPRWGSKREGAALAAHERAWIEREIARIRNRIARPRRPPPPDVVRALREQAHRELLPRTLELAARHGLTVARVSIRNQRWRWGSCSRSGHICLNWRLVQMPAWVRDYVIVHELMHLKRMDHSPRFWKLVAAACPEFTSARAWLRDADADPTERT